MNILDQDILENWESFLCDLELARNYRLPFELVAHGTLSHVPNPILKHLLPTLLYIRLVTILDEALAKYIKLNDITVPKKGYSRGSNLDGKIRYLRDDHNLFNETSDLLRIKDRRNSLAHQSTSVKWEELSKDLSVIEKELQQLQFVSNRPEFSMFCNSGGGSPVPPDSTIEMRHVYSYGLRMNGDVVQRISWQTNLFTSKDEDSSDK